VATVQKIEALTKLQAATVQKIQALTVMPSGYCFNQIFNAISATYSEYDFE
jgi:hypothetical protein